MKGEEFLEEKHRMIIIPSRTISLHGFGLEVLNVDVLIV
jgi:hypothetical protein